MESSPVRTQEAVIGVLNESSSLIEKEPPPQIKTKQGTDDNLSFQVKKHTVKYFLAFFTIGLINNFGFVMV